MALPTRNIRRDNWRAIYRPNMSAADAKTGRKTVEESK
jgi:hypothetical protein